MAPCGGLVIEGGYRLGDAGPHPNKAHAAWGRRAHRLEPDPVTAPVVRWMFAQRLAGHSAARITRALNPEPGQPGNTYVREDQILLHLAAPMRWGRMMVSPFTYYRGAALPMASDLAATPVTGLAVQACGDAHLSNFGLFGSAERRLVFDVNDFDETLPGPWEWDVKRLAASLEVAGRDNGFPRKQRREIIMAAVGQYRQAMRQFAGMGNLDVWYANADIDQLRAQFDSQLAEKQRRRLDKGLAKARTRDSMQEVAKLTQMADGEPRIISDPPVLVPIDQMMPTETSREGLKAFVTGLLVRTSEPWRPTAGTCSSSSDSATWPARSSASAASERAAGSS